VIVKKIPPSKMAAPKSLAANVRALADYIAGPQAGGDGEKVEHRVGLNFLADDHDSQVQEMIDLAEVARQDAKPVQHWILSWREGEQPTPAQADEAAKMFLDAMGLAEHQAIYALHSDTDNWHLHLAINRVHPETEKVVTVNKGYALPDTVQWNFALYQPQAVIINLGTNDFGSGDPGTPYETAYVSFVQTIRQKYADAYFILIDMYGGTRLTRLNNVLATLKASGESKANILSLNSVQNNLGCNQHPNVAGQQAMGTTLAAKLRTVLGW
jgi:Relaxase/Mobilisation nuclease domain